MPPSWAAAARGMRLGRAGVLARRWVGRGIVLGGVLVMALEAVPVLADDPNVVPALLGGLTAAAATALGVVPVLLAQRFSQRALDAMMGYGAGLMLAASCFSLIVPALEAARRQGMGAWGSSGQVAAGVLLGAAFMLLVDRLVPHEHFVKGLEGPQARKLRRAWLFVLAVTLHNLPEGLSIGVAFAGTDAQGAQALTAGISIQDVPEGLVVALALRAAGYGRASSCGMGVASGLVEPVAAVLGAALIGLSTGLLPWGLAAAAGAMLYVISHEVIPESHRQGHEAWATAGLMLGFVSMLLLDTAAS